MILVTGGTGLVGSHLLYDLVRDGKKVRALKRAKSNISIVEKVFSFYTTEYKTLLQNIEWVEGDVTDIYSLLAAMEGIEIVYHCAGKVSYDPRDADDILKTNSEGTANIVNVCLEKKIKKLLNVSSVAAFGDVPEDKSITEDFYWKGSAKYNHYSISKYNAEREVWRGISEGLNAVIVNPAVIVGPGDWNLSSCAIFKESYKGIWFYPRGSAGYVDVRDVSKAMILLCESEIKNERFILSAENFSLREFANNVHDALGKKHPYVYAGKLFLGAAWRLEKIRTLLTGKVPVVTKVIAEAVHARTAFSSDKLRKALTYNFIPIKESVKFTAGIFLEELK